MAEMKTVKFQMMMEPSLAQALDEWGWKHRVRSRAEAIRLLVRKEVEDISIKTEKADATA